MTMNNVNLHQFCTKNQKKHGFIVTLKFHKRFEIIFIYFIRQSNEFVIKFILKIIFDLNLTQRKPLLNLTRQEPLERKVDLVHVSLV